MYSRPRKAATSGSEPTMGLQILKINNSYAKKFFLSFLKIISTFVLVHFSVNNMQ